MTKFNVKKILVLISVMLVLWLLAGLFYVRISDRKQEKLCDLDGNGSVGFSDLIMISLKTGTHCNLCPEDLNKDGVIDQTDISILQEILN